MGIILKPKHQMFNLTNFDNSFGQKARAYPDLEDPDDCRQSRPNSFL